MLYHHLVLHCVNELNTYVPLVNTYLNIMVHVHSVHSLVTRSLRSTDSVEYNKANLSFVVGIK